MAYEADTTQDILKKVFNVSNDALQTVIIGGASLTLGRISLEGDPSGEPIEGSSTYGLEVDITRLPANVSPNISSMQNNISSMQDDISQMQPDVSLARAYVSTIKKDISVAQNDISSIQNNISSVQANISLMQPDISQIQVAIGSIKQDTSMLQNDISTMQDDTSLARAYLSIAQNDISVMQVDTSQIQQNLSSIQTDISVIQSDTSQIKTYASTIASALVNENVSRIRIADTWTSGVHGVRSAISTAAVRIAHGSSAALKRGMLCRAHRNNATIIYVGFAGVTGEATASTCGHPLVANQSFLIEANNSFSLFAIANATAQKLHYFGV